jgi:hypothetical protein
LCWKWVDQALSWLLEFVPLTRALASSTAAQQARASLVHHWLDNVEAGSCNCYASPDTEFGCVFAFETYKVACNIVLFGLFVLPINQPLSYIAHDRLKSYQHCGS